MSKRISVIIPNHNGSLTIGKCLTAVFSSSHEDFEVIVVDDGSTDGSVGIIRQFPCKLVHQKSRSGASKARNTGALHAEGKLLFFIDADCLVQENTLTMAEKSMDKRTDTVVGGTYTPLPHDDSFFSVFQSVFINYSETKRDEPDYVATHAMAIDRELFMMSGGFPEDFLPILEDVEFSHRLRRAGYKLRMDPGILVTHIFNFTLWRSIRNAVRKSKYWTAYSLTNKDILADSGTASAELKTAVVSLFLIFLLCMFFLVSGNPLLPLLMGAVFIINVFVSRKFLSSLYSAKGFLFTVKASAYYFSLYSLAVGAGALAGIGEYFKSVNFKGAPA